jgi:L-ribulose-5-phosphate 4-epimerase
MSLKNYSKDVIDQIDEVKEVVCKLHQELIKWRLVAWTAGNISQKIKGAPLFVIKPSGVLYDELTPNKMVVCDFSGELVDGEFSPSSDTKAHAYVYSKMPDVYGVVHTHSTYATAFASVGKQIPCNLTMMADEFGGPIPIGPFAIIGDDSIGKGIVETLKKNPKSPAVLMQNHGPFTVGKNAHNAVKASVLVEEVAKTTYIANGLGAQISIPKKEIEMLYNRYQNVYGQKKQSK